MRVRAWVTLMVVVFTMAGPAAARAADEPNTTCGLDAVAAGISVVAEVSCLQLDPDTYGEFDAAVTVTLQVSGVDGWADAAAETCTGSSTRGVLQLTCSATSDAVAGHDIRGLVDLDKPKDWGPAIAEPTYFAGEPSQDPLAEDECQVNEAVDAWDLTAPDAPWVDLCDVTAESQVDEHGSLESLTVVTRVAGGLNERLPTGTWRTELNFESGCSHDLVISDGGVGGVASAAVETGCGYEPGVCTGIPATITELLGGGCATTGTYDREERVDLPEDAVSFQGDRIVVTLRPGQLSGLVAADLVAGATIDSVSALTTTGVATDAERTAALDYDFAYSTGRSYTLAE